MALMYDITPKGWTVRMRYNETQNEIIISCAGSISRYDEDDCDRLLRLIEVASDPVGDLEEFFEAEFGKRAFRVAVCFRDHARDIAKYVYEVA